MIVNSAFVTVPRATVRPVLGVRRTTPRKQWFGLFPFLPLTAIAKASYLMLGSRDALWHSHESSELDEGKRYPRPVIGSFAPNIQGVVMPSARVRGEDTPYPDHLAWLETMHPRIIVRCQWPTTVLHELRFRLVFKHASKRNILRTSVRFVRHLRHSERDSAS